MTNPKLVIGYFYKKHLNLYGDNGNVEILCSRASQRNIPCEVIELETDTKFDNAVWSSINLVFMGGGPDSGQKNMYDDLLRVKGAFLREYILNGGVGLYICGSYQLLGSYYKSYDGAFLEGLGVFDLYTEHFGLNKPRCIGNTVAMLSKGILEDSLFKKVNNTGDYIVGFENHGGRTYLKDTSLALAQVVKGFGNNGEDSTEGMLFKNSFGSYFHGPLLAKNPHMADFLIAKALKLNESNALDILPKLNDNLINSAHAASKKFK